MDDTVYIFGTHEPPPAGILRTPCWLLHLVEVGHDSSPHPGVDMSSWEDQGYLNILRIQHLWGEGGGCIPISSLLAPFVHRVVTCVENSKGCSRWVVGNEPNHSQEWPDNQPISPDYAAMAYNLCRTEIHSLLGHEDDEVLLMPVAPWNAEIGMGWVEYFARLVDGCDEIDAFALHTYSRGADPSSIVSEDKMGSPYEMYHNGFRTYRDWLQAIPDHYRDRPIYITETNQNAPWLDENTGWVRAAYREIDEWNGMTGNQTIYALLLYRWPRYDGYYIEGKQRVIEDFAFAQQHEYTVEIGGGEDNMWQEVHSDGLDEFYDQGGIGELTIPVRHQVTWDRALSRPEMDAKDDNLGHPEVYSPRYSAVGFLPFKMFKWWCFTDAIPVTPGRRTRGRTVVMIVSHGTGGDPTKPGACGMRVGLSEATVSDPSDGAIAWSDDWWVVRDSLANERVWHELVTPEFIPTTANIRLWIQCNADVAADISAGHWDDEVIEQWTDGSPPIPPGPPSSGPFSVETYVDGQLVATGEFHVQVESLRIVSVGGIQVAGQESFGNRLRRAWRALWMRR